MTTQSFPVFLEVLRLLLLIVSVATVINPNIGLRAAHRGNPAKMRTVRRLGIFYAAGILFSYAATLLLLLSK